MSVIFEPAARSVATVTTGPVPFVTAIPVPATTSSIAPPPPPPPPPPGAVDTYQPVDGSSRRKYTLAMAPEPVVSVVNTKPNHARVGERDTVEPELAVL